MSIDAAAGSVLMGKSIEAARALWEEMVSNNYHWSAERATLNWTNGVYGADAMDLLTSKVDTLARRFDRLGTPSGNPSSGFFGPMFKVRALYEICGIQSHVVVEC